MARRHLSTPSGQAAVEGYLSELASRLHGPRRPRARILAELRDGLQQAVDSYLRRGSTPDQAAAAAIAEFGAPDVVARAFSGELATAHARRTIAAYILTGPLVGIWWLLLLRPYPWHGDLIALLAAIPVIPMIAIILGTAVATLATTGSLIRWLPETNPRSACNLTLAIAALVLTADLTVIALFLRSDIPMRTLAAIACTASLIRIACGALVLRRTIAIRHTLQPTTRQSASLEDHDGHR